MRLVIGGIGSASTPVVTRLGIFVEYTRYIDSMISSVGSPYRSLIMAHWIIIGVQEVNPSYLYM